MLKTQELTGAFKTLFESSLHMSVEVDANRACEFIDQIGSYNEFEPEKVKELINRIEQSKPPDILRLSYRIGREHSPVLYVEISKRDTDKLFSFTEALKSVFAEDAKADEYEVVEEDDLSYTFRYWWD